MKTGLLCLLLAGVLPLPLMGGTPKPAPRPAKPAPAAIPVRTVSAPPKKAVPVTAAPAKKPRLTLKSLFSKKPAPPAVVAVAPKAAPPAPSKKSVAPKVKAKPVPVIVRNTSEFVDISFPEPRKAKSPAVAASKPDGR